MTGITSGGGGGYDYVETYYPSGADEGESLYHLTDDAAFVFNGSEWVEQTVTDHSQLSGVSEGDHRSDSQVGDLARTAVDGSNVAVEEANTANVADVATNAENADQLGGQDPSHFETPTQTGEPSGENSGWMVDVDDQDFGPVGLYIDAIRFTLIDTDTDASVTLADGREITEEGDYEGTVNIEPGFVDDINTNNGYSGTAEVDLHAVHNPPHTHPI